MKFFGVNEFEKFEYTIPNLPSNISLFCEEVISESWRTVKKVTLKIDDKIAMISGYPQFWYEGENYMDTDLLKDLKIATKNPTLYSVLDGLYYKYNPVKLANKSGKLYKKTYKALRTRLRGGRNTLRSYETFRIAEAVYKKAKQKIIEENPNIKTENLHRSLAALLRQEGVGMEICYITGDFLGVDCDSRILSIRNRYEHIKEDLYIEDYGYVYNDEAATFLGADEGIVNETIYNKVTDSLEDCPACGRVSPKSYLIEHGECPFCIQNKYKIHNYSTKVPDLLSFKAKNVTPNTLYMGIELEFETSDREEARVKVGKALNGHAIMKSDGSIGNGFEVVTCPATPDIHLEIFKTFYESKPYEINDGPHVGMHIHVSRKPLSDLTVGKLTAFMNNVENSLDITKVAGRKLNRYCNQSYRTITYTQRNGKYSGDRFNTLNLRNKETIEFRIFKTPLTFKEFKSKVEFCQALVEYCKPCSTSYKLNDLIKFSNFNDWVVKRRKQYPELVSMLKGES